MPIPIGLLFVAARAAAAAGNGNGGGFRANNRTTVRSERVAAFGIWAMGIPMCGGMLTAMFESGEPIVQALACVGVVGLCVVAFPWLTVRWLLVPRGFHRASHQIARMSLWVWGGDREGGAIVAGALAAARIVDVDKKRAALAWLDNRVMQAKRGHGALLVGQSLLARLRGEHERADRLLHAAALLHDEIVPVIARGWASEAAIGHALASGNLQLARRFTGRGSRRAELLHACVRALTDTPPPVTTSRVTRAWRAVARAWRRVHIRTLAWRCFPWGPWRRLVHDALDALDALDASDSSAAGGRAVDDNDDSASEAPDFDDALLDDVSDTQRAVLWLARARKSGAAIAEDGVVAFGDALDDAVFELSEIGLDGDLHEAAEDALGQAARDVTAAWSRQKRMSSLSASSSTLSRVLDGESTGSDELAEVCEMWRDRREPLPAAAELEDWARLRALYEAALVDAGDDNAMGPYLIVRDPVWNHSALLFNKGLKGLGRAMFSFLWVEASKRKDESAIKGMVKNLKAA